MSILSLCDGSLQEPEDENISVRYLAVTHRNIYLLFLMKLWVLVREGYRTRADVYHCHEPESHLAGIAIKLLTRKKLVLDVHEYYPDMIELAGRFYKYFYLISCYVVEPLTCWLDDCIICADDEIRKLYAKFNKRVVVIYNYPLTSLWDSAERLPGDTGRDMRTLIYAGWVSEVRGAWSMLAVIDELAKTFPDIRLKLIGGGSSVLREEVAHFVASRNLDRHVTWMEEVPHEQVAKHLRSAGVGLLLYEPIKKYFKNIPTKQYEYAASELPYVGTELPPISRFIEDARCGIAVRPNDVKDAVAAVRYLLEHPAEAEQMGANGRRAVYERYNWGVMEKRLVDAYSAL